MEFPRHLVEQTFLSIVPKSVIKRTAGQRLLMNGRCPICNEGKSKSKKRFYLYEKSGGYFVNCKNCNYSKTFNNFVKDYNIDIYESMQKQCFSQIASGEIWKKRVVKVEEKKKPSEALHDYFKQWFRTHCVKLSEKNIHPLKEKMRLYSINVMRKRGMPEEVWEKYYFCYKGDFVWRIIIPFINTDGYYYNFQARDVHRSPDEYRKNTKYIFAKFDDIEVPDEKIYKQYLVDVNKTVYVCEGILDSEFIDNSVATCGTGIGSEKLKVLERYKDKIWCIDSPWQDESGYLTICKMLEADERCFIIPKEHSECKDINDLILKLKLDKLPEEYIKQHIYHGKAGLVKLRVLNMGKFTQESKNVKTFGK